MLAVDPLTLNKPRITIFIPSDSQFILYMKFTIKTNLK